MRRIPGWAPVAVVWVCAGLFAFAPNASAQTLNLNARAQVGVIRHSGSVIQLAGVVSDPSLGQGGLLVTVRLAGGAYSGSATYLSPSGGATLAVRVTVRSLGQLAQLGITATVTAATGRLAGAHGTLTGSTTVNASVAVGVLRLHGTLRGVAGRAPAPLRGVGVQHVDGQFRGIEVSLNRSGLETIVGSATGIAPGPAVVVVHDRATRTSARGTFTLFVAGGSLNGAIAVRLSGSGAVRSEAGTATIRGGAGEFSGARSSSAAVVTGTRNLFLQVIALRIRGAFTP